MEIQKQKEDNENAKHQLYQTLDQAFGKRDYEATIPRNVRDQHRNDDQTQQGGAGFAHRPDARVRNSAMRSERDLRDQKIVKDCRFPRNPS